MYRRKKKKRVRQGNGKKRRSTNPQKEEAPEAKTETSSNAPSEQSSRTDVPTPLEVEGGTALKVGKLGAGKFRVIIEKIPKK